MQATEVDAAPYFTAEDERREISSLTVEDMLALRSDMLGLTANMGGMGFASTSTSPALQASSTLPAAAVPASLPAAASPAAAAAAGDIATLLRRHERHVRAEADLANLRHELDALPTGEKVAYLLAVSPERPCCAEATGRNAQGRNRHLAYLEACNYDAAKAARKIAQYWTERLELFGPARAFLRMNLHGVSEVWCSCVWLWLESVEHRLLT